MNNNIKIKSWDPTYGTEYVNNYYNNNLLPFNVRPVATIEKTEGIVKYIDTAMKNGYIPMFIEGSKYYDGGWALCSVYEDEKTNDYLIILPTIWIGYPVKKGVLSYVKPKNIASGNPHTLNKDDTEEDMFKNDLLQTVIVLSIVSIILYLLLKRYKIMKKIK